MSPGQRVSHGEGRSVAGRWCVDDFVAGSLQLPHRRASHRVLVLVWADDPVHFARVNLDMKPALLSCPCDLGLKLLLEVVHGRHRDPSLVVAPLRCGSHSSRLSSAAQP